MMRVEIFSRESIKPSSPTPPHLRTFKLSLLDQLIPAPFAPIVLFYPNYDGASHLEVRERCAMLKQSLSETLTRFYPLAGLIKDDLSIDCNDDGAYVVVAEVKDCRLSDFLNHPDIHSIHQFLPCEPTFDRSSGAVTRRVTNIQLNVFDCGGIAIGLCISHKIVDGAAICTFLKGWAAAACGPSQEVVYPNFSAPSLFPANDLWLRDSAMVTFGAFFKQGKWATKRLVFDASAIASLKAEAATSSHGVKHPSRVEVVSAFIWKSAMAASKEKLAGTQQKPSILTHVVNLRKRMPTTLSQNSLGNLIWFASAKCKAENRDHTGLHGLVHRIHQSISKIDGEFVKELQGDNGATVMSKSLGEITRVEDQCHCSTKEAAPVADIYGFTSWCKLGFYEVDFGWGKPMWVSNSMGPSISPVFMNFIVLIDTRCGEGIEAWVTIDEQEMEILEHNLELLRTIDHYFT